MIRDDINKALTEAQKAKNERTVSTLRMVNSTLKNADIEARTTGKPLGDAEVLSILQKMIKQRQESIEMYRQGGRQELVDKEAAEIVVIESFMPTQMAEDEIRAAVAAVVAETGAASIKDMGKVMAELRARHAGVMDFAKAGPLVKAALG